MTLRQFEKQKYLNIETFRKNGQGVKTPVWFVLDENTLHVWTQAESGKARRIRRDGSVRVVPSTAAGDPRGEWVSAQAVVEDSLEVIQYVESLMKKKYGLLFLFFRGQANRNRAKRTTLKISLA
jgi:PPOX class probable F420-dependent enzyme